MAKFTVFFNDKAINTQLFETGVVHIGRDDTNDLAVDSLAVAPAHAVVVIREEGCLIKQLNENFPLVINAEKIKEAVLNDGDKINVGKHSILFTTGKAFIRNPDQNNQTHKDIDSLNQELQPTLHIPEANLQVMDGKHIGRMIPLKKAMTRLGHSGGSVAVIAKRKDGYFISALEGNDTLTVNHNNISDNTIKLNNNDLVIIDHTTMQFFVDKQ